MDYGRFTPNWVRQLVDGLLAIYCMFGAQVINKQFFGGNLSAIRFALLVMVLFISGYPIWGWKRNSAWSFVGRWTFYKWVLFSVVVGILVSLLEFLAKVLVR